MCSQLSVCLHSQLCLHFVVVTGVLEVIPLAAVVFAAVVVTVVVVAVVIDQKLGKMTSPYSSTFSYKDNSISQFLW